MVIYNHRLDYTFFLRVIMEKFLLFREMPQETITISLDVQLKFSFIYE